MRRRATGVLAAAAGVLAAGPVVLAAGPATGVAPGVRAAGAAAPSLPARGIAVVPPATGVAVAVGPPSVAAAARGDAAARDRAAARCEPIRVALRATGAGIGAAGYLELAMAPSPFGVSVSPDGRYLYDVTIGVERLRRRPGVIYVAWASTPELDRVVNLGALGEDGIVRGRVGWNKFLVLVTAEAAADGERWEGPILLTGTSPSGLMHTMRGHGIFEAHGIGC